LSSRKIKGIIVKLGLDTKEVTKGLDEIDKAMSKSSRELKEIDKALKLDPKNTVLLAQKQQVLTEMLEKSCKKMAELEALRSKMDKAAANNAGWEAAYKPLGEQIDKVQIKLSKLEAKKEETDKKLASGEISQEAYDKYQNELKETRDKMQELIQKKSELEKKFEDGHISAEEYRTYRRELEQTSTEMQRLQTQSMLLDSSTNRSSAEFRRAVESTDEYKQAMSRLSESSSEAKEKIGELINFALKLGGALATAAVGAATAAVNVVGSQFDASMSSVQALSRTSGAELDSLREKAMEMGASTSKTASEAADALGYMALAGWDTQKMLSGINPMLKASEAGTMDLATCSDLVTDSMSSMGVAVEDLTRYLDICAQAQRSSNTSLQQLLEAYVVAGGSFRNFNTSMEESATILGILANRGKKGSEAGNNLNSVLINLIGASGQSSEALEMLGVSAYDSNGKFIGITNTIRLVSDKLAGLDDQQRDFFIAKIGGKTQYDTLQALISGVNEEYDTLLGKITDSNGALEETAAIMRDNLKGDVTTLTSALQDAGIQVNDHFTAAFRDAAQEVTGIVRELSAEFKDGELGDSLEKIAAAFGKAIKAIAEFAASKAIPATVNFFEFIADHGDGVISIITGIGAAFASWKILGAVTAAQKAVTDFRAAVAAGSTATQALGTVAAGSASGMAILGAGAIAVTAAVSKYVASKIDAASEELRHRNRLDETTQALYDQAKAYAEVVEIAEENCQEADDAAVKSQHWWEQVQKLANENGRAKGSAGELQHAVEELNKASGMNIEVIDGQIQGYADLCNSMDDYIERTRREAKLSFLHDSYGEAITNIDEAKKQADEAYKELTDANADYLEKRDKYNALSAQGASSADPLFMQAAEEYDEAEERFSKASVQYAALSETYQNYSKIKEEYENIARGPSKSKEEATKEAAAIDGERLAEINRQNAELAKKGVKQTYDELEASLADLDDKLAIHAMDENTYWAEKKKLLEESPYEDDTNWWKEYDKVTAYYDKLAETEKKAREDELKAQEDAAKEQQTALEKSVGDRIDTLKLRNKTDNSYTKDMLYKDMELIISGLDKQSDVYKNYYAEILEGRKQLSDDMTKQTIDGVQAEIQALQSEYSTELGKITAEQNSYKNKLLGMVDLYTNNIKTDSEGNKSGSFILEDIDAIDRAIDKYDSKMNALEKRGAGKNLINFVHGLSGDDEEHFTKMLQGMSSAELKAYSDKYDNIMDKINEKAEAKYQPQIDAINNGFIEKVRAKMKELSGEMSEVGLQAIDGFIAGFTGDSGKLIEAVSAKCTEVLDGFKNGLDIHSPSKETAQLGEYTAVGFLDGLSEISGAGAAEQFADDFIAKMAEKDPELREALNNAFTGNMAAVASEMNAAAGKALSGITSNMPDLNLPDISAIKLKGNSGETEGTKQDSSNRVTAFIESISERLDEAVNLLTIIAGLLNREQVIRLESHDNIVLQLDGETVAKVVSKMQKEHKRRADE